MAYPDFDTLVAIIADELHEPSDTTFIGRCLAETLLDLRGERFLFTEKNVTVTLVAGTTDYDLDGTVFPADLLSVKELVKFDTSLSDGYVIPAVTLQEFRQTGIAGGTTSGEPQIYTIYDDKIRFWPNPASAYTLSLDYQMDASKDEATGDQIDPDATTHLGTHTNEFFRRARKLLKCGTAYNYAFVRSRDQEAIQMFKAAFNEAFTSLRREQTIMQASGKRARNYW